MSALTPDSKFGKVQSPSDIQQPKSSVLDNLGSRHPISLIRNQIVNIFSRVGFTVSEGPEIEDDWHNFTALNLPEEHPARDMQDTFFIQSNPSLLIKQEDIQSKNLYKASESQIIE